MNRLVHDFATLTALLVLGASLWQDWGTLTTLRRMLVAYLCCFGLGAGLALAIRAARVSGNGPRPAPEPTRPAGPDAK